MDFKISILIILKIAIFLNELLLHFFYLIIYDHYILRFHLIVYKQKYKI